MADDSAIGLAEFVRTHRLRAGLTQEDLAERSGLTVDTIGALERGLRRRLYPHTAAAIADALVLPASERADLTDLARGPSRKPAVAVPGQPPATAALHNLPTRLTAMIGRERELLEVEQRVLGARLLTLTGPGGIGKTRLVIAAAESLRPRFPRGAWFVELAPVTTSDLALKAIAEVLRVRQEAGQSLRAALIDAFQGEAILLVLDNCEQVLNCAPDLAAILGSSPALTILATSRSPLHISGEQEMPVPVLSAPNERRSGTFEALAGAPAVRLFVERAKAVNPNFALTPENATDVAEICSRLDCLPLALELAAARVKLFTPNALLARLDQSLALLTGGPLDHPERQRTLRAAIEWSYNLLSPAEQTFFRQLGVFVGGFTLAAAEACCPPELAGSLDVLDALSSLVDKSLIRRDTTRYGSNDDHAMVEGSTPPIASFEFEQGDDGPRFTMLQTINDYARERLDASNELESAATRHLIWCQELMGSAAADLEETAPVSALFRARALLAPEQSNLRAAISWAVSAGRAPDALRLAASLSSLWVPAGNLRVSRRWFEHSSSTLAEARLWLEQALALPGPGLEALRADALYGLGRVLLFQWEDPNAERGYAIRAFKESAEMYRRFDEKAGLARCLIDLAFAQFDQSELGPASEAFEESLALAEKLASHSVRGWALIGIGRIAQSEGDYERAAELFVSAYEAHDAAANLLGTAAARDGLGLVRQAQRDLSGALDCFEEAVAIRRRVGAQSGLATALQRLSVALGLSRQPERALDLARESLLLGQRMANPWDIMNGLLILASMAGLMARPTIAARLFAAGEAYRARKGLVNAADYTAIYGRSVAAVSRTLGEQAFATESAIGAALTLDAAIAEALQLGPNPPEPPG
ncbi:MAG: tetratricopeptide repeat protein [bacterium]